MTPQNTPQHPQDAPQADNGPDPMARAVRMLERDLLRTCDAWIDAVECLGESPVPPEAVARLEAALASMRDMLKAAVAAPIYEQPDGELRCAACVDDESATWPRAELVKVVDQIGPDEQCCSCLQRFR